MLMIALILISAAVVSFSDLPLRPSSAEQHKRIPHSASRSDNPAFLFLFFCTHCKPPFFQKKTYTVEEIAEQLCVSKKVAYALVKSGQFAYVRAGRAIRVSKDSFDKWLNQN